MSIQQRFVCRPQMRKNIKSRLGRLRRYRTAIAFSLTFSVIVGWRIIFPETLGEQGGINSEITSGGAEIAPNVTMPLVSNGIGDHALWIRRGGRGIDTAYLYGDSEQRGVGKALRESGLDRVELFLTTKVTCCPTDRCNDVACGKDLVYDPESQISHSLELLGVDYVDLLLLHFPCSSFTDTLRAWRVLETAHKEGRARSIGVSNFNSTLLDRLIESVEIVPAINQCAFSVAGHPASHQGRNKACQEGSTLYGSDMETVETCKRLGITYAAYSPLGHISRVHVLGNNVVKDIASLYNHTPAQTALRWVVQQGIPVITSSRNAQHMDEILCINDFSLSRDDMVLLKQVV